MMTIVNTLKGATAPQGALWTDAHRMVKIANFPIPLVCQKTWMNGLKKSQLANCALLVLAERRISCMGSEVH